MEVVMKFFNIVLVVMVGLAVGTTYTGEIAKINENLATLAGLFSTDQEAEYNRLIDDLGKLHKRMPGSVESMTRQQLGMSYQELLKRHLIDFLRRRADIRGKAVCFPLLDSIKVWIPDYPGVKDRRDMLKEIFLTLLTAPLCTEQVALSIARYAPGLIQGPTRGNYDPKILANYARQLVKANRAKWAFVAARLAFVAARLEEPELLAAMQKSLDLGKELFDAVIKKDLAKVQELIAQGASLNMLREGGVGSNKQYNSPIAYAAAPFNSAGGWTGGSFSLPVLQALIDAGANPNIDNNKALFLLLVPPRMSNVDAIQMLVNQQTNLSNNRYIITIFRKIMATQNINLIRLLLDHHANPHAVNAGEPTIFEFVSDAMHSEDMQYASEAERAFYQQVLDLLQSPPLPVRET